MAEKEMIMKLKVDVQCQKCMKKVNKVLCKFPEIRDKSIDEKQNLVTIKVVCSDPEKLRDKICCKSEGSVKTIKIEPPRPPSPPPIPSPPPPLLPPPPPPVCLVIKVVPFRTCCVPCCKDRPCGECYCDYYCGRPPACHCGCDYSWPSACYCGCNYGRPVCDSDRGCSTT